MTPIEKNVIVVDELGNEYEATYPKRAKGLVKNGRARFIDDNTICLACPPNTELEEATMSSTTKTTTKPKDKLTINYVLNQIEQIVKDNEYIHNALEQLALMPKSDPGDIAGQEKAKAIGDIVRCRETTNQQALRLYEKMYDDLKPQSVIPSERMQIIHSLIETLGDGITPIEAKEALENILGTALQDLARNI
ncbi:MAG: hypothetical protein IJN04_00440 [Clostridia bacterium]|nr:hypothetical protein [Clostridia bacterium]